VLFNSYAFLFLFLPVVLVGFALCVRAASQTVTMAFLIAASLVFYGWWNWHYLPLLGLSMAFNYAWARVLRRDALRAYRSRHRLTLGFGIAVNLGVLGYFKYAGMLVDTFNALLGGTWRVGEIVLPLAISFFTFEQITYLVDAYRGQTPAHTALHYATFMTFFPRLIAGPIVRPREMLPQLTRRFHCTADDVATGLFIFAIGLCKKVVFADTLSAWVGPVFDQAGVAPLGDAWAAVLAYTLQIYFDFSGYSDMAIGLARMFGITLPENFDSPYQADSIGDYWRRWHITLSSFLRDYVYIPLGGNRLGAGRSIANLLVTMLLGGLWHGANWTFVVWGGVHGALLGIERLWRGRGGRLPMGLARALTFTAVVLAFVLFRAPSFERAGEVYAGLAGLGGFAWDTAPYAIAGNAWKRLLPLLALVLWCPNRREIMAWQWRSDVLYAAAFAALACLGILSLSTPSPFLYFQF
jgi:D-alanyl-lipoteichoic acid acyltransferase DltB (MBOAT superfamily)